MEWLRSSCVKFRLNRFWVRSEPPRLKVMPKGVEFKVGANLPLLREKHWPKIFLAGFNFWGKCYRKMPQI